MKHTQRLAGSSLAAGLMIAGSIVAAGPAGAASVPLPRPKPDMHRPQALVRTALAGKVRIRRAGPDLALGRVPLPRPRPDDAMNHTPPLQPSDNGAIRTGKDGQVVVSIDGIGNERDPLTASELRPDLNGQWPKSDVEVARQRCAIILATSNIVADLKDPIGGPEGCGIAAPIKVTAFGAVTVKPAATLNCTLGLAAYKWVTQVLQPAAVARFGEPVISIHNASAYTCRRRNNAKKGRISEHAFGNALDVSSFELVSGKIVTVKNGWSTAGAFLGMSSQAAFLKDARDGACTLFSTVLGPRANALHVNHFHLDLGRGGRYKICE